MRLAEGAPVALAGILAACNGAAADSRPAADSADTADTASEADTAAYDPPDLGGCVDAPAGPVVLDSAAYARYVGAEMAVSDPDGDGCPAVLASGASSSVDPGHAATYLAGPPVASAGLEDTATAVISLADPDDDFAHSVGVLDGGRVLAVPSGDLAGAIYLFDAAAVAGAITAASASAAINFELSERGGQSGYDLATGDADGDGTEDILVSDLEVWEEPSYTTRVWLIHDALDLAAVAGKVTPDARLLERVPDDAEAFGRSLALADLDGDGLDDTIVGDPAFHSGTWSTLQRVFIWAGPVAALPAPEAPAVVGAGSVPGGSYFGYSLATGDVDADGYLDLAVGARNLEVGGELGSGGVFVFHGPVVDVTADEADAVIEGVAERWGGVGESITMAAAGPAPAPLDLVTGGDGVHENAGAVYRVPAPLAPRVNLDESYEIARGGELEALGLGVANLGDVDGDGIDDIVASCAPVDDYGALWFLYSSALAR